MTDIYDTNITKITDCYVTSDDGKTTWFHDKLGSFLINVLHLYTKNECLYIYKNGIYVRNDVDLLRAIQYYKSNAKESFRKEVEKYCKIAAPIIESKDNINLIACQNGVYDMESNKLINFSPAYFLQHKINAKYDADAYCESVDKLLNAVSCNDKEIRMLIEEMIGYCLHRNCRYQKMFLLSGFGKNGKSTLIDMIINLMGEENISALSLTDLQDKFKKAELQDKLVNICDDLSNEFIKDSQDFKKIITGGIMTLERKNQHPFKYRNYAKLIMAANEIPKSSDKSEGYYRRFIIVPLKAKFDSSNADFDPNIADKVQSEEARSYLLNIAIEALKRIKKRGGIIEITAANDNINEYKRDNDPILAFVEDYNINNIYDKTTSYIFREFNDWYEKEYNRKPNYNKTSITKSFKNNFDIDTKPSRIGGKIQRIYQKRVTDDFVENSKCNTETDIFSDLQPVNDGDLPY